MANTEIETTTKTYVNTQLAYVIGRIVKLTDKALKEAGEIFSLWHNFGDCPDLAEFINCSQPYQLAVRHLPKNRVNIYNRKMAELMDMLNIDFLQKSYLNQEEKNAMMLGYYQSMDI